jgi:nucleoside-diphosphate-sugar epimerase
MQTILGSGGAIGTPLARELKNYTSQIRLVSRNPKKVNETDELYPLDVKDLTGINKAVAGSEVVYVTIGFAYKLGAWQKTWPPFMKEVISACRSHGAQLVFFDNVYAYAKSAIPHMTETSPRGGQATTARDDHERSGKEKPGCPDSPGGRFLRT